MDALATVLAGPVPGEEIYDPEFFRTEWDPVTHLGRVDGSATVLLLGEDPVRSNGVQVQEHELLVNTFVYALAPGAHGEDLWDDPGIVAYRHLWLDVLLGHPDTAIADVRCLGPLAVQALAHWQASQR